LIPIVYCTVAVSQVKYEYEHEEPHVERVKYAVTPFASCSAMPAGGLGGGDELSDWPFTYTCWQIVAPKH
jgi:hypothetical protein